jgi:hypothetical protein
MERYYDSEKEYMSAAPILVARSGHASHGDLLGGVVSTGDNNSNAGFPSHKQAL